jgi:type II secretory pathway pseudopilin PulG
MGQSMEWVLGGVGSLVATAIAGRVVGRVLRPLSPVWYWIANAVVLLAAVALMTFGTLRGSDLYFGIALGIGFGGLAGLRQGCRGLVIPRVAPSSSATRDDAGFTLIESLAAAGILLVVAGGVITTLIATSNWYANARLRTQAYSVANQVMSNILARNYSDIHFAAAGETWPGGIPEHMNWPQTGSKQFTVYTSMETTTDPKTYLEMKKISVAAIPVNQSLTPTVTVVRFTSGWQQMASSTQRFYVTVKVRLVPLQASDHVGQGARVQLLDPDTLAESYFATTDRDGIATFYNVLEGQYYLTSDPRFGTNIRPVRFPQRISPTHGGSANNPIMPVNSYDLLVTNSNIGATLKVGAYRTEGWTVVGGLPQPPEIPYRIIPGLTVYAVPVLNGASAGSSGYYGMGDAPLYPLESKLGVYSATANAYGVAAIPIPWTIDSSTQYWNVWCRTVDGSGHVTIHRLTTTASGGWDSRVQRPDGAFNNPAVYGNIPQFSRLGGESAYNSVEVPDFTSTSP